MFNTSGLQNSLGFIGSTPDQWRTGMPRNTGINGGATGQLQQLQQPMQQQNNWWNPDKMAHLHVQPGYQTLPYNQGMTGGFQFLTKPQDHPDWYQPNQQPRLGFNQQQPQNHLTGGYNGF